MLNRLLRGLAVSGCVALLAMPMVAAQGSGGGSCAAVSVVPSTTVTAGYNAGIHGSINNCSGGRKRYTIVVSAVSDCGQKSTIASFRLVFKPGENRMYGVSWATPADTCAGPATITTDVIDGDGVLATASGTTTIVN